MNFVFATDPHVMDKNPSARLDAYPETILKKLEWVVDFANENDAILLLGGDILDKYNERPAVVNSLMTIFAKAKNDIFCVVGNHDVYGQHFSQINNVILGTLFNSGIFKPLTLEPTLIHCDDCVIQLTGGNYVNDMESHKEMYQVKKLPEADKAIHVVHGFLIRKHWPSLRRNYTLITDIFTEADITCAGHEHQGFGILEFDNRFFTNPGALGRVTASLNEIQRMPAVTLMNVHKGSVVMSIHQVPFALAGGVILSREKIELEIERKTKLEDIKEKLDRTVDVSQIMTLDEIFEDEAKIQEIPKAVYDICRLALAEVGEATV